MTRLMRMSAAVMGAIAFAAAPLAAEEIKEGGLNSRTHKMFKPDGTPLRAKTGITSCELCGRGTCTRVRVQGPCTVPKAIAVLKRRQARLRHRERAVTSGDYKPLAREEPGAPVGRAKAAPKGGGEKKSINPPVLDDRSYDDLRGDMLRRQSRRKTASDADKKLLQLHAFNPTELTIKKTTPWVKPRAAPIRPEVDDEVLVRKKDGDRKLRRKRH